VSLLGMWVQRLTVGWLIWEMTESGLWLGAVAMAEFIPTLVITPLGGVLADRFDRRNVALINQSIAALQAGVLWLLTLYGYISPEWIVALVMIGGSANALNQAARITLVVNMVPKNVMSTAIAITSVNFNIARIIGPAIAGIVIAYLGAAWAFAINALTYLALIAALMAITLPPTRATSRPRQSLLMDIVAGARHTFTHKAIAVLMLLTAANSILARPVVELLPGFVGAVFNGGPGQLAILTASMGVGAIIAGLWLAQRGTTKGLTTIVIYSIIANGFLVLAFASTGILWLGAFFLMISGMVQACSGTGMQTLLQAQVEDRMRGRVMSAWLVIGRGGPALGALVMGWIAETLGFGLPLQIGGVVCAVVALYMLRRRSWLKRSLES